MTAVGGRDLLRAFGACLEAGDALGAAALFAPDATYDEPPAHMLRGRAAIHAFIADFAARHHSISFTIIRALADPAETTLAVEWRWAHTRSADGERKVFEGMSFVDFRDGRIARWRGFSARAD